eukprot:1042674-Rhodomonas_salina.1
MQASRQVHPQPEPSSETVLSPLDDKMDVRGNGVRDRRVNPEKFNTMTKASDRQIQDKVISMDASLDDLVPALPSDHKHDVPTSSLAGSGVDDDTGNELNPELLTALANVAHKNESVDSRRAGEYCLGGRFSCGSTE